MIFIFELLIVSAQLSLFPIEGQSFYYSLGSKSQGYMVSIDGETLGFRIYNGISGSRINNLEFPQCNKIISTSIYEKGNQIAMSCLTHENVYQIQLNYLGYDQNIKLSDTYNISGTLNCTSFIIFDESNLLTNCYTEFGEVIYIITKNGVSKSYNTTIKINLETIQKVSWQIYQKDQINIYVIYVHNTHTIIYLLKIKDSDIKSITKFWKYAEQFIQIHITYADQIFALSQTKLMYNQQNTTLFLKNTQNTNFISMDVYVVINNYYQIVICDQGSIYLYSFITKFNFRGSTQFNYPITQASLYVDKINLFVVSDQQMLYYDIGQQNTAFRLVYYLNTQAYSDLNLFNFMSEYLINFNKTQYQLFQIMSPYIYSQNPSKSGELKLMLRNPQNNTILNRTISIQVQQPQNFWKFYHKDSLSVINGTIQGYESFRVNLDQFIGPNQSFILENNEMFDYHFQQPVLAQTFNSSYIISHSIIDLKAFLIVSYDKDQITVCLQQYDYQTNQVQNIWEENVYFYDKILGMSMANDVYNTDLIKLCIVTPDTLYIFYIDPLQEVKLYQTFDLLQLFNQSEQTYLSQVNFQEYLYIIYTNKIYVILIGEKIKKYSQTSFDNMNFVATNYKKVVIIENKNLMFFQNNLLELKPIIQFRPPRLNEFDQIYIFPTYYGSFILFGQKQNWKLQFIDEQCIKQTIVGQLLLQSINIDGYDFSQQIFTYTILHFYAIVYYQGQQYLNIYRQSYHQQNFLYQSIYLNNNQINSIEVSKDLYFSHEYVTIMFKNNQVQLFIIPISLELRIYPKFILQSQYNIQNQLSLQNQFSQYNITLQVNVQQQYLKIDAFKNSININASVQQDIYINLNQIFKGAIQNYTLECDNCIDFSYESILNLKNIINGSFNQINSNQIDGLQYLYLGQSKLINQYKIDVEKQNQLQDDALQQQYQVQDQQSIIYSFIEYNTQKISWIVYDGEQYHINTIIENIQQNISLSIRGQINSINYKDGFLQIGTINSYYCFTYLIFQQKQKLLPLLTDLQIQKTNIFQNPYIQIYRNLTILRFGTILQSSANTLILILIELDITQLNEYILNDFNIIQDFNLFLCRECHIHSLIQVGQAQDSKEKNLQGILLCFTTDMTGRGVHILFESLQVYSTFYDYTLVMINSTKLNGFHNMIVTNSEGKIVILNSNKEELNQINFINFYDITTNYTKHQIIYPYYFINTSSQYYFYDQLQYINTYQLVICQNKMVQLINQQSQMKIKYNLNQNSTLRLKAQNQYSSVTYLINLQFDSNEPSQPIHPITKYISNNWYWILIFFISIFLLLILVKSIQFIKQIRQDQYRRVEEIGIEIRIKTQIDN